MKAGRQITRDARLLFRLCLVNGSLDELRVRQVVQGILRSGRRGSRALLSPFVRRVRLDHSRHMAQIESATPLPADLKADVQANIAQVYGSGIISSFLPNPALIGGMRIRVGNDLYDGSISGGLAALEKCF